MLAYYWLKSAPTTPLKLELVDAAGKVAACAASDTPVKPVDTEAINVQAIWEIQPPPPSNQAGTHRVSLDVRPTRGFGGGGGFGRPAASPPVDACHPASSPSESSAARARQSPATEAGLQPGEYTVRLTVDGQTLTQPVTLKPDPRNIPAGGESTVFSPNANSQ